MSQHKSIFVLTVTTITLMGLPLAFSQTQTASEISWESAVSQAERNNPEVHAAKENLRAAEAKKTAAYAGFLPNIRATLGYETTERSSGLNSNSAESGWNAGVSGSLNLFSGFSDSSKLSQAEADRQASEASLQAARAKVSSDLKNAYEAVAYARDYSRLTSQILKRRSENLRLVQLRFESGRENKGSVLLSEAYLEQAKYDDLQAINSRTTASASLMKLLGIDPDSGSVLPVLEVSGNVPLSDPPSAKPDMASLVLMTPDYVQAVQQTVSLEEARRIARASFFPTLDLTSSIGKRGDDFFPDGPTTQALGISLSIPLFTGGRNVNQYRAAAANASASAFTRENTIREIRRKLEQSWSSYIESVARLRMDDSFRKAAVVRSEVARTKYNNGLLSFEDWDIIENDLINRQKSVLQTRRERTSAEAAWELAQGIGVFQNTSFSKTPQGVSQ
ncbi:MAG: TolC family protein [Bdellovibrionales bacterium]|nr:TolC family protein [Bdellovibrionales bacterium]